MTKKILLVEDDLSIRDIYKARLEAEDYKILVASSAAEALELAKKEKPDLIIADVMMPVVTGFDLLKQLRAAPETKDTKVLMTSALSQVEDQNKAMELGATAYIVKAKVGLEDIVKKINKLLKKEK